MKIYSRCALILSLLLFVGCGDSPLAPSEVSPRGFFEGPTDVTPADSRPARGVLNFVAPMDPGQEVHDVESRATGVATFQYRRGSGEIQYRVNVANIENVTMAHIHLGERGVTGPAIVWLYPDSPPPQLIEGRTQGILAQGVITSDNLVDELEGEDLEALLELMQNGETYVNVHTEQYGAGEIRGQIDRGNGVNR